MQSVLSCLYREARIETLSSCEISYAFSEFGIDEPNIYIMSTMLKVNYDNRIKNWDFKQFYFTGQRFVIL